ncbi:TetR/AcrR family transcriptional regulator [Rhodococcus sp. NPDC057529]|uniref:TetR/AcrR family transcriptional regulator n=1 Tax=Rhodococcus sp. NPDC057529 TaxID=3346158 RepID=UPI0036718706
MPRRTDARERMIDSARQLFRQQGYSQTAFSDVLAASGTPRGSVYFHFPGGKQELARSVADLHIDATIDAVRALRSKARSPGALVSGYIRESRDRLLSTDYTEGCAVAPLVTETLTAQPELAHAVGHGFSRIIDELSAALTDLGVPANRAHALAAHALAGVEGALIVSRATRSVASFDALIVDLANLADTSVKEKNDEQCH